MKVTKKLKRNPKATRVVSWNVCGLRAQLRKGSFLQFLESFKPEVMCLNETMLQDKHIQEIKAQIPKEYFSYWFCSQAKKGYSGVAILSLKEPLNVTYGMGVTQHDQTGRTITAEYQNYFLVCTYVPSAGNEVWRRDYRTKNWDLGLRSYLQELQKQKPVVWAGDMNVVHQDCDVYNIKGKSDWACCTPEERNNFGETLLANQMVDSFRFMNPRVKGWSYFSRKNVGARLKDQGWRLDYIVVSEALKSKIQEAYIRNDVMGSDHHPCVLSLLLSN